MIERPTIVCHPGLSEIFRLNPALAAIAVSEYYTTYYRTLVEDPNADRNGRIEDAISELTVTYFMEPLPCSCTHGELVVCSNCHERARVWREERRELHVPCSCYHASEPTVCINCQNTQAAEKDYAEFLSVVAENFRFNHDILRLCHMYPNMTFECIDGNHVICGMRTISLPDLREPMRQPLNVISVKRARPTNFASIVQKGRAAPY